VNLKDIPAAILKRNGMDRMLRLESEVAARPDAIHATERSPVRFEIFARGLELGGRPPMTPRTLPHMLASMRGIMRSLRDLDKNPAQPRTHISPQALEELEEYARLMGVPAVSYTQLPRRLVFVDKAVVYDNAIVLLMEMDKDKIEDAPGLRAALAVHETYHHLGDAANRIARYLRQAGYGAHAGHPLNGMVLYPPLAQQAGLGWRGQHGMLISPQFGPCMRLAAVFTSIENLPFFEGGNEHQGDNEHRAGNAHAWVEDYCRTCGQCVRRCPTGAILEQPLERDNGLLMCMDAEKCFPYFMEHHGCSVCIKVCPFNRVGYEAIKECFEGGNGS
jgi:NAD-dependent dihydropyrimidine dehydrogenase PreA subunit